ncbi:MAG: virulence-associated E family protein [Chloroflexi bacterium]|nr:virulence-associated E family protein [Chloroflexota bacterium]
MYHRIGNHAEVCELGSTTRRADREALKYFLSLQQVTVRKPYGRYDLVKPALASFIGTVNNTGGFLDDPTGYRRFMSVHLESIDWAYSRNLAAADLWAQARALYAAGEPWELTREEAERARVANERYEIQDPLQDLFLRNYEITGDPRHVVATADIRDTLNQSGWRLNSPRADSMAIAAMLRGLGVEVGRQTINGRQERAVAGVLACRKVSLD